MNKEIQPGYIVHTGPKHIYRWEYKSSPWRLLFLHKYLRRLPERGTP